MNLPIPQQKWIEGVGIDFAMFCDRYNLTVEQGFTFAEEAGLELEGVADERRSADPQESEGEG